MGDDHPKEETISFSFLKLFKHENARELFAKIDYCLRDGVHIQRHGDQESMFRFIEDNFDELRIFYQEYYAVTLDTGGESTEKYYFINFSHHSRGNILYEHRYFMPNEYVIIGFLIYKIIFIDGYVALSSVAQLKKIIRNEYEELKPGLYRAIAKAKRDRNLQMDDDKIDKIVLDALSEFKKVGWIRFDGDSFDTLPSFERLPKIYGDYINDLDSWLSQTNS